MTVDLLGDLTLDDCEDQRLLFDKNEIVEFICIEPRLEATKGHIYLKARVNSGIHKGKEHSIMIPGGEHEACRKRKAKFLLKSGFFTDQDISTRNFDLKKLMGRKFSAKASAVTEKNGNKYQNMEEIRDLGVASAEEASAPVNY